MFNQLKKILFVLGIGLLFAAVFITVNTILDFGIKLAVIHSWLAWGFYLLTALFTIRYLVLPIFKLMCYPKYQEPPKNKNGNEYNDYLFKLRNQFLRSEELLKRKDEILLPRYNGGDDLKGYHILRALEGASSSSNGTLHEVITERAIPALNNIANKIIMEKATSVGALTAISQSGRLDLIIVLVNNIIMVNQIVKIYRSRPSIGELLKLYGLAGSAAFVADQLEEIDVSEMVGDALQGLGAAASITPYAGTVLESLTQGIFNAFLTLRVGHSVKNACGATELNELNNAKTSGRKEAGSLIKDVATTISKRVFSKCYNGMKNLFSFLK